MLARIASYSGPCVEDVGLAGDHVGRHRAKRDRQAVEIADRRRPCSVSSCRKSSRLPPDSAPWKPRISPSRKPISSGSGNRVSRCLSRKLSSRARRRIGEQRRPVDRGDDFLHRRRRHAARVEAADDRAHRRRGDVVDRNAQFVQHLEHADVRDAARAAAGEHEADPWAPRAAAPSPPEGSGRLRRRERGETRCGDQQREARNGDDRRCGQGRKPGALRDGSDYSGAGSADRPGIASMLGGCPEASAAPMAPGQSLAGRVAGPAAVRGNGTSRRPQGSFSLPVPRAGAAPPAREGVPGVDAAVRFTQRKGLAAMKSLRSFIPPLAAMLMAAGGGASAQGVLIDKSEIRFRSQADRRRRRRHFPQVEGERRFPPEEPRRIEGRFRDRAREHRTSPARNRRAEIEAPALVRHREVSRWRDSRRPRMKNLGGDRYEIAGPLSIKGVTRDVVVPMALGKDGAGNSVAEGKFTRQPARLQDRRRPVGRHRHGRKRSRRAHPDGVAAAGVRSPATARRNQRVADPAASHPFHRRDQLARDARLAHRVTGVGNDDELGFGPRARRARRR